MVALQADDTDGGRALSCGYLVDAQRAFDDVLIVQDENQIMVVDFNGEVLLETIRPAPGTRYVGRLQGSRPNIRGMSPKS